MSWTTAARQFQNFSDPGQNAKKRGALSDCARAIYNPGMPEPHSGRLQQLLQMLEREPNDAFLLYGIAIEYKNLNEANTALEYLGRVLKVDPNHSYTYYQQGQILESTGEVEKARAAYQQGIEAANRTGDAKAKG